MNAAFKKTALSGTEPLDVLTFEPWAARGVPHGFALRWRRVEGTPREPFGLRDQNGRSRRHLTEALGLDALVAMCQVHGDDVKRVSRESPGPRSLGEGGPESEDPTSDGIVSSTPGLGLLVQTADCVPLLYWDPERRAVGAVHAGWRGTLAEVAIRAVECFARELESRPEALQVVIGPAIGRCCYEVGDEVALSYTLRFEDAEGLFSTSARGRKHLDLLEANRRQLVAAGVRTENVAAVELCTSCENDWLYSFRREGTGVGRLFSAIGIASGL